MESTQRSASGMVYGITHSLDGQPIIREPKILKVGIGCPKGPAIDVYIKGGSWVVRSGYKTGEYTGGKCKDRAAAEAMYLELKPKAPACPFPRKLDYFTFTRQIADGTFEPDFDAIEAHGERPGSIDLVFFDDQPLEAAYQLWGASELKCSGNGLNATRVLAMAETPEDKAAAETARQAGSKYFPILDRCYVKGCPYGQETTGRNNKIQPAACKPHAVLKFQLARNLRLGGVAYFTTTGRRSISQLHSCLYRFRTVTGGGSPEAGFLTGIPFKMVLKPFRTNHAGQPGTAYGVSLEFRADTVDDLLQSMITQGLRFRAALTGKIPAGAPAIGMRPNQRALEAGESPADIVEEDEEAQARAFQDEFVDDGDGEGIVETGEDSPRFGSAREQREVAERKLQEAEQLADQREAEAMARIAGQAAPPAAAGPDRDKPVEFETWEEWNDTAQQAHRLIRIMEGRDAGLFELNEETGNYKLVKEPAPPAATPVTEAPPAPAAAPPKRNAPKFGRGGNR